jgi:hypothetical protein
MVVAVVAENGVGDGRSAIVGSDAGGVIVSDGGLDSLAVLLLNNRGRPKGGRRLTYKIVRRLRRIVFLFNRRFDL